MKLIAIDMDGTLLSNEKTISQANIQAIQDAKDQGHIIMICSGRPHDGILQFLAENKLDLPLAGSNGAVTYTENKIIHSAIMDVHVAAKVFHQLEEQRHPFKIYTNKGVFTQEAFLERAQKEYLDAPEKEGPHRIKIELLVESHTNFPSNMITTFEDLTEDKELVIFKYFVFVPHELKKQTLHSSIESIEGLAITSSGMDNLEIMGTDGNKGTGLKQMAKHYHIPIEDTIAIGDNFNDLPMLNVAGLSVAMENAEENVKKVCDVITLSNEEDGVAYAIRKYVLNEDV